MKASPKQIFAIAVLIAALSFASTASAASSLVGTWQSSFSVNGTDCSMQSIYQSDGTYSELLHCGSLMTHQSGTYVLKNGLLVRGVTDWDPKQQWVVDAYGGGHYEDMAKPPGGSYQVTFVDANTITLQDVNMGGSVTMHRQTGD
jgi:hypothetical protein